MDVRIAYFIDRIIEGGTELQLAEQIDRFREAGIHQRLFCLYQSEEHRNVRISCPTTILGIRKLLKPGNLKKVSQIVKLLRAEKINVVQTYFFDSSVLGVLCGNIAGVKKIISCRRDMGFWYTKKLLFYLRIIDKLRTGSLPIVTPSKGTFINAKRFLFRRSMSLRTGLM